MEEDRDFLFDEAKIVVKNMVRRNETEWSEEATSANNDNTSDLKESGAHRDSCSSKIIEQKNRMRNWKYQTEKWKDVACNTWHVFAWHK